MMKNFFVLSFHLVPQQPKMKFFQLKKVFAIWLNAPLEANKLKCIVIISIIIVVVDIRSGETTNNKGLLQTYYLYNLYSIIQPDFQLTFCKYILVKLMGEKVFDAILSYSCMQKIECVYARKGYEMDDKHGNRKLLLASMSSLNRYMNTRLNCCIEIECEVSMPSNIECFFFFFV